MNVKSSITLYIGYINVYPLNHFFSTCVVKLRKEMIQMQTSDGKIVYLMPTKTVPTTPTNVSLPSGHNSQQYLQIESSRTLPSRSKVLLKSSANAKSINKGFPSASTPSYQSMSTETTDHHTLNNVTTTQHGMLLKSKIPSKLSEIEHHRLREVEALEAKISSYQNVVEKYEKLAEDATTAAIVERKAQLRKLETQLRKREQEAKNKLATAINVIEESQMIDNVIPVISDENSAGDHHAIASAQNWAGMISTTPSFCQIYNFLHVSKS